MMARLSIYLSYRRGSVLVFTTSGSVKDVDDTLTKYVRLFKITHIPFIYD